MDAIELVDFSAVVRPAFERFGRETVDWFRSEFLGRQARRVYAYDHPPYWRAMLLPTYKAHRPPSPPGWSEQRAACRVLAELDAYATLPPAPGEEADDVIASVILDDRAAQYRWIVVTSDKDMLQLEASHCELRKPNGESMVCRDRLGVAPHQVADYLALVGDPCDGVAGCPGVGKKRATAHLGGTPDPKATAWMGSPEHRLAMSLVRLERRQHIDLDAFFDSLCI